MVPVKPQIGHRKGTFTVALDVSQKPLTFQYRVTGNDGTFPPKQGRWHVVDVLQPPSFAMLDGLPSPQITLVYPEYTQLPSPQKLSPGVRHLDMIQGTEVQFRAAVDRPLKEAWIEVRPTDVTVRDRQRPGAHRRAGPAAAAVAGRRPVDVRMVGAGHAGRDADDPERPLPAVAGWFVHAPSARRQRSHPRLRGRRPRADRPGADREAAPPHVERPVRADGGDPVPDAGGGRSLRGEVGVSGSRPQEPGRDADRQGPDADPAVRSRAARRRDAGRHRIAGAVRADRAVPAASARARDALAAQESIQGRRHPVGADVRGRLLRSLHAPIGGPESGDRDADRCRWGARPAVREQPRRSAEGDAGDPQDRGGGQERARQAAEGSEGGRQGPRPAHRGGPEDEGGPGADRPQERRGSPRQAREDARSR